MLAVIQCHIEMYAGSVSADAAHRPRLAFTAAFARLQLTAASAYDALFDMTAMNEMRRYIFGNGLHKALRRRRCRCSGRPLMIFQSVPPKHDTITYNAADAIY